MTDMVIRTFLSLPAMLEVWKKGCSCTTSGTNHGSSSVDKEHFFRISYEVVYHSCTVHCSEVFTLNTAGFLLEIRSQ
jgi:hypothetical protein